MGQTCVLNFFHECMHFNQIRSLCVFFQEKYFFLISNRKFYRKNVRRLYVQRQYIIGTPNKNEQKKNPNNPTLDRTQPIQYEPENCLEHVGIVFEFKT